MRSPYLLLSASTAGAILAALATASAQQGVQPATMVVTGINSPAVEPGDYKPLEGWQVWKLAGAYFTNSRFVHDTKLAYQYSASPVWDTADKVKLFNMIQEGKVALATEKADGVHVLPYLEIISEHAKDPGELTRTLQTKKFLIVSDDPTLFGRSSDRVLYWVDVKGSSPH